MNQWLRMVLEVGPLIVFFLTNANFDIFVATGSLMVAIVVSLGVSFALERRLPVMPVVTGAVILVFGGLTLLLEDETFIKLKPTIVNLLFSATLFTGIFLRRNFLKIAFQAALSLEEQGWRILTWRWAWFFIVLAILNEIIWRTQTTDVWVNFKVFGIMPLTLVFSMTQIPLILRYQTDEAKESG